MSGYYKSIDNLIRDISKVSLDERYQIYFILNRIKDECYDRKQCEHMMQKPANTTNDKDIEGIKWIFIDFDANQLEVSIEDISDKLDPLLQNIWGPQMYRIIFTIRSPKTKNKIRYTIR